LIGRGEGRYKKTMSNQTNFYQAAETVFLSLVEKGGRLRSSTARAGARDIQKAFLRTVVGRTGDLGKLGKSVAAEAVRSAFEDSKNSKAGGAQIVTHVEEAIRNAFKTNKGGRPNADVHSQLCSIGLDLSAEQTAKLTRGVIEGVLSSASSKDVDPFVSDFLDKPTRAVEEIIEFKKSKFFTRGVSDQEIQDSTRKELGEDLKKVLKKALNT